MDIFLLIGKGTRVQDEVNDVSETSTSFEETELSNKNMSNSKG